MKGDGNLWGSLSDRQIEAAESAACEKARVRYFWDLTPAVRRRTREEAMEKDQPGIPGSMPVNHPLT